MPKPSWPPPSGGPPGPNKPSWSPLKGKQQRQCDATSAMHTWPPCAHPDLVRACGCRDSLDGTFCVPIHNGTLGTQSVTVNGDPRTW